MSVWYVFVIHSNSRLDCGSCPYQRSAGVDRAPRGEESERGRDKVSLSPAVWRPVYRAPWCLSAAGMPTPPRRTGHQCLIHVGSVNIQRPHGWQICHASLLPWGGRHPECQLGSWKLKHTYARIRHRLRPRAPGESCPLWLWRWWAC